MTICFRALTVETRWVN